VIVLSFLLVLVALGLLVTGLVGASQVLIWGSIAASVAAGCCLVVAVVQQRRFRDVDDTADLVAPPGYGTSADEPTTFISPAAGEPAREPARAEPPSTPGSWREAPAAPEPAVAGAGADHAAGVPQEDTGRHRRGQGGYQPEDPVDEPPEEDVAPEDVLRTADLPYDVLVVDGRPRYHLVDCPHLHDHETVSLPLAEAREVGFTPCSRCRPDGTLAARARERFGG
jgi:hypothetical protein